MKKTFRTVALLSVLSMAAVGCQKEMLVEPSVAVVSETSAVSIVYTVDGVHHQATFDSDAKWQIFLHKMFAWAEEGHTVSFSSAEVPVSTKQIRKIVTYETRDVHDAETWADAMKKEGYKVTITHDSSTGIYTCIAIK